MNSQKKPLIRVTSLEAYRRYMSDDYPYITEQSLIDGVTGGFVGNEYTYIGTAFHSIVETGKPETEKVAESVRTFLYYGKEKQEPLPCGRKFNIEGNDVILDVDQCKVALAYREEFIESLHEIRTYKDYGEAIVTGCADMINGNEIRDIKTKYSAVNDDDYINSAQWRFYLELFGLDTFHFDLFVFKGYNKEKHGMDVRGLSLERHLPAITCYRYKTMEEDNRLLLESYLGWIRRNNLEKYFINY